MTISSSKLMSMTTLSLLLVWSCAVERAWASDALVSDKLLSFAFPIVAAKADEQPSNHDANRVKASGKEGGQSPAVTEGAETSPGVPKKSGAIPTKSGAAKKRPVGCAGGGQVRGQEKKATAIRSRQFGAGRD